MRPDPSIAGILRSWNAERGFGFIAPTHGGREVFVHLSAFPRDGSRPVEGESLFFEPGRGKDGRPQAVRVVRQAIGTDWADRRAASPRRAKVGVSHIGLIAVLVVAGLAYGYNRFRSASSRPAVLATETIAPQTPPASVYRCDGRKYCAQMTSCAEATYFLKNCPGVKMDGNNDGVPCEQQWCK